MNNILFKPKTLRAIGGMAFALIILRSGRRFALQAAFWIAEALVLGFALWMLA